MLNHVMVGIDQLLIKKRPQLSSRLAEILDGIMGATTCSVIAVPARFRALQFAHNITFAPIPVGTQL